MCKQSYLHKVAFIRTKPEMYGELMLAKASSFSIYVFQINNHLNEVVLKDVVKAVQHTNVCFGV